MNLALPFAKQVFAQLAVPREEFHEKIPAKIQINISKSLIKFTTTLQLKMPFLKHVKYV